MELEIHISFLNQIRSKKGKIRILKLSKCIKYRGNYLPKYNKLIFFYRHKIQAVAFFLIYVLQFAVRQSLYASMWLRFLPVSKNSRFLGHFVRDIHRSNLKGFSLGQVRKKENSFDFFYHVDDLLIQIESYT